MLPADEQLMAAYAEGDMQAFELLYHRHRERILGYLFNRLRDRDEAEEVFQTVFAKLHAARDRYREDIPFLPWIFTIARNALIDHLRKNQSVSRHLTFTDDAGVDVADPRTQRLPIGDALAELSSLSPGQRQVLELRFDQDLSFEDIALQLQTSSGNARQLVSRAVRRLRKILSGKEM
ncbi:RNA polymerase sigma factor [Geoalkalibacter halelectricus]|uniref:Sigma-70 family RNA polymerase sigma factor n=1 Tax=Geoalkalibacter halelectricus TaxID=2847045 RepID=A0ABY5ZQ47_9BACT|nr:sigma-70 family RNA polymerase sigma factor [Geoalkalibacter halelectricus]MDO3378863.1 sigma-70 family RNA polymerase sigma factor [Geoalkalibacter halelectricus]UWZ79834.1 sigma-70 family RNA polymerase sigma factor [Geoalkalibacter halelectricus]